jgi:hypothetical protein
VKKQSRFEGRRNARRCLRGILGGFFGKVLPSSRGAREEGQGRSSPRHGVHDGQIGESTEVAVRGPQLAHAVLLAQSGDAGVVNACTCDLAGDNELPQVAPVLIRFRKQHESRSLEPGIDLIRGRRQRRRRIVDARMRRDGEKLVQAGPRNGPRRAPFRETRNASRGGLVKR